MVYHKPCEGGGICLNHPILIRKAFLCQSGGKLYEPLKVLVPENIKCVFTGASAIISKIPDVFFGQRKFLIFVI